MKGKLNNLNLAFFGTPNFSCLVLDILIKGGVKPIVVVTKPDKPVGRKKVLTPTEVKTFALKEEIEVVDYPKMERITRRLKQIKPDIGLVAYFGRLIPPEIFNLFQYGCLNIHPSLLPKYRGATPGQSAILNGDKISGFSIMKIEKGFDTGEILAQEEIGLAEDETTPSFYTKAFTLGAKLFLKILPDYLEGRLKPIPQDNTKATYTKSLTKENGKIDWTKSAQEIERHIRAYYLWPGSWSLISNSQTQKLGGKKVQISKARILPEAGDYQAREVFLTKDKKLAVQTGNGILEILRLKLEGKEEVSGEEFLRGYPRIVGSVLE